MNHLEIIDPYKEEDWSYNTCNEENSVVYDSFSNTGFGYSQLSISSATWDMCGTTSGSNSPINVVKNKN